MEKIEIMENNYGHDSAYNREPVSADTIDTIERFLGCNKKLTDTSSVGDVSCTIKYTLDSFYFTILKSDLEEIVKILRFLKEKGFGIKDNLVEKMESILLWTYKDRIKIDIKDIRKIHEALDGLAFEGDDAAIFTNRNLAILNDFEQMFKIAKRTFKFFGIEE